MKKRPHRTARKNRKYLDLNVNIRTLSTLDDIAIRSYYVYMLLTRLVGEQQKSTLELISLPLNFFALLFTLFLLIEKPWPPVVTILLYAIGISILIAANLRDKRKQRGKKSLEEQIYMAIYIDEMLKDTKELTIVFEYGSTKDKMSQEFVRDVTESLEACIEYVETQIEELTESKIYPECLADFGMDEDFVNRALAQAKDCVQKAKLFLSKLPSAKKRTPLKKHPRAKKPTRRKKPKHIRVTITKKATKKKASAKRKMRKHPRVKKYKKRTMKKRR